ncbi:MAG: HAMP domain-containing histidine kinase, partial [Clostridiales bacterium]|nr:HAMP domain-containing histidine kinase [Clostridiales bacterium]
ALAAANVDLIKLQDTEGRYVKHCALIQRELSKINDLVRDFIQSAREDEKDEPFDISEMLYELAGEYRDSYESIDFILEPFDEVVYFVGQKRKIRMLFTNLLNNSVEAVAYHGRIEILAEITDESIKIYISDDGVGLGDTTALDKSFFTTKTNGTGMGLPYCRNTVAQYGGKFNLQNRPEGGCRATVELPNSFGLQD